MYLGLKNDFVRTGNKGESSKKERKPRLSPAERRQKAREAKRMRRKLAKAAGKKGQGASSPVKKKTKKTSATPTKPIFNSEGKVVFSKFDFSGENGGGDGEDKAKKRHRGKADPKAALEQIRRQKEKIQSLEAIGEL